MAIEDFGALEVGRVPGIGDVHRARTRHDGGDGPDLGTISGQWIAEHRAHERELDKR